MKQRLIIDIANLAVAINVPISEQLSRLQDRYAAFLKPESTPLVEIDLHHVPDAQFLPMGPGITWEINVTIEDGRLLYESYFERGWLDLSTGQAEIEANPRADIENYLRVIYAWLCLQHDSLLLHGAGVIRDNAGYIFFGPSGAGKSTTAGLSAEVSTVLSDDIVVIRKEDGQYYLCGVPFVGELSDFPRRNERAPLKAIYRLQQDMFHHVEPLPNVMGIAELAASAPFIVQHRNLSRQLMDVCTGLNREIPVQKLHFARNPAFWEVISA